MLAWTKENTMQSAMRTVLEWPQSHATRKTINMITNKYEPQQKCRLGSLSLNVKVLSETEIYKTLKSVKAAANLLAKLTCFSNLLHGNKDICSSSARYIVRICLYYI